MLESLRTCVDQQRGHMASCGLLDSLSEAENEEEMGDGAGPDRELLLRLARRAQLWPVLEELAILNQMKVTADLLHQSITHRYDARFKCRFSGFLFHVHHESWCGLLHRLWSLVCLIPDQVPPHRLFPRGSQNEEEDLRRSLSNHLRFCMQSTPMNIRLLQPMWFLLSTKRVCIILQRDILTLLMYYTAAMIIAFSSL